jgi:hypothetical protein
MLAHRAPGVKQRLRHDPVVRFVLTAAVGLVLATQVAVAAPVRARVVLTDPSPVTLRGVGFEKLERVQLSVSSGERSAVSKRLRAGERGRFLVVFRELGLGRCGGELSVKAVGNRGSRVAWVLRQPDCDDD